VAKNKSVILDPQQIMLNMSETEQPASLSAAILANCPGYSSNLPVAKISFQALSPTNRFWLRWIAPPGLREAKSQTMLVQGDDLVYLREISAGVNDFFDVANKPDVVCAKGPFFASSEDVVGQSSSAPFRLFILSQEARTEILELEVFIQVSKLGNYTLRI